MRAYLAAPFGERGSVYRKNAIKVAHILEKAGLEVYRPWTYKIPNAWDFPNHEWGEMVFMCDVRLIDLCDIVVVLSYGRWSTAGTNWEAGYAFGTGKKVILVEMTNEIMSVMVSNGRYASVHGIDELKKYDFTTMPKTRTTTEQK